MTKRFGFTLAEVLITLGIIGVVAAMTMPTLINQTNGAQYKAAYKKALSAISQGVTLNVALDDISFADAQAGTAGALSETDGKNTVASILGQRMNVAKNDKTLSYGSDGVPDFVGASDTKIGTPKTATSNTTLFFNDGSAFSFPASSAGCTIGDTTTDRHICKGFIDVNGVKGPNREVTCDGTDKKATKENCTVKSPTDIYPVIFYDQTILPGSDAARAVLYGK